MNARRMPVFVIPLAVLGCAVIADFALAGFVGVNLGYVALLDRCLESLAGAGIGYWIGWKVFRSGPAPAQWHLFGVFVSCGLAGSLYLVLQLFIGKAMPAHDSGWGTIFNLMTGGAVALYLATKLEPADAPVEIRPEA